MHMEYNTREYLYCYLYFVSLHNTDCGHTIKIIIIDRYMVFFFSRYQKIIIIIIMILTIITID